MKKSLLLLLLVLTGFKQMNAQAYDIRINMKGLKDTMVYLVKYTWDKQYVVDTCKKIKNEQVVFKGNKALEQGVYILVSQASSVYFEFFVTDAQKFSITGEASEPTAKLKVKGSKDNELFFGYLAYVAAKNKEFGEVMAQTAGKSRADSTSFVQGKIKDFMASAKQYDADFMIKTKGSFVYDFMNLKTEKEPASIPKASNGRPDSLYSYYYYKNHYFEGVDFKDERIVRTPLFDDRVKNYFERVIVNHPDTVIREIDLMLAKCTPNSMVYNQLIGYFTYKYEQSKIIGFDKVFVHLADQYILPGKAKGVYTEETTSKIKERVDIMRNLLLDAKVADLYMIDTAMGGVVRKMGFDTASSSKSVTDLYYKNMDKLSPMYKTLYSLKSKYTVLIFWAADCGHCQTEVPKLHENLKTIQGSIDFKVFAVQTKDELYQSWKKFIIEKKLSDFIHVFDPVHINNLKERFDIYSTPVIYILDKDKKIKAKRLGAEQVVDFLKYLETVDKQPK